PEAPTMQTLMPCSLLRHEMPPLGTLPATHSPRLSEISVRANMAYTLSGVAGVVSTVSLSRSTIFSRSGLATPPQNEGRAVCPAKPDESGAEHRVRHL